jgi:xylulokinase
LTNSGADRTGPLLVGLDVGTTNIKAVVVRPNGEPVAIASAQQEIDYPQPGWACHKPERIWEICCQVLRDAVAQVPDPGQIQGVAVASMGEAGVTLDEHGEATYDVIAWFDRRTVQQTDQFSAQIDSDELFAITGTELQPIMTAPKLMWIRDALPEVWARTRTFLNVSAYVAHRLGADYAQDHSLASRTGLFDLRCRDWSDRLMEIADLNPGIFGDLAPGGTRIGSVSTDAATATGLPAGIAIGLAGHDHICGAFAAGVIRRGDVLDSIGTAEGLLVCLDQPVEDVTMGGQGFTQGAHVVPDQYYGLGAIYTAGASYEWARQAVGGGRSHDDLLAGARSVPAGSLGVLFLPHLRLAMFPELDSRARGAFVGLTTDVTSDAMIRAVLEGVAMEGRAGFGPLARYARLPKLTDIKVIGGTSRNQLLIEIKASVMNARHHVLEIPEATALGAAMLAGMAAGVYRSADDAIAAVRSDARVVEPDIDVVALYDTLFEDIYRHLYGALRPMHHRLFDLFLSSHEVGAA